MSTFVERNFRVKGIVDCVLERPDGTVIDNLSGIEVQLWHKAPMESIFLGKALTNDSGEYIIDILIDSPVTYIEDGSINRVFTKMYYKGELLNEPEHLYDPDAMLYFEQLTPQPSALYKEAVNTLIKQLKADGNWNKLDRLWNFATEYQQHATVSVANPSSSAISEVNSPTWAAGFGYTGNGTTQYLDTGFIPSSGGMYAQNNGSIGFYSRTNSDLASGVDMGCSNGTSTLTIFARNGNTFYNRINAASSTGVSNTDSRGFFAGSRSSSTTQLGFKNGSQVSSGSQTSNALVTYNMYIMAYNNSGGGAAGWSTRQYALAFIGTGAIDQGTLYIAVQNFATTIGFNV